MSDKFNDLDLNNFDELSHIKTKSIWLTERGDFSNLSTKDYGDNDFHTRFHPEIPYQMILRYTKKGEIVWDPFAGSGTTVDVARELDRNVVANDINPTRDDILERDSRYWQPKRCHLAILHPPYWKMVKYDDDERNLCNCEDINSFREEFGKVVDNVRNALEDERFAVLVISDVYSDKRQYPLDCYCLREFEQRGFRLKGRIVKDFGETKGTEKSNSETSALWRYRALKFGFWSLGIDNILVFEKVIG